MSPFLLLVLPVVPGGVGVAVRGLRGAEAAIQAVRTLDRGVAAGQFALRATDLGLQGVSTAAAFAQGDSAGVFVGLVGLGIRRGQLEPLDAVAEARLYSRIDFGVGDVVAHTRRYSRNRAAAALDEFAESRAVSVRRAERRSFVHHIASPEDAVYGPKFERLFRKAGLDLQTPWNLTRVPGHVGPHGKFYNKLVFNHLQAAAEGKTGAALRASLLDELWNLRRRIQNGDLGDVLRAAASRDDVLGRF